MKINGSSLNECLQQKKFKQYSATTTYSHLGADKQQLLYKDQMNAQFISLFLPITAKPIVVANPFANLLSVCTTKKLPLLVGTLFCKKNVLT